MKLTTDKVLLIRAALIKERDELKGYLQNTTVTYNKPALKTLALQKLEDLNNLIAEADEFLLIQDSITPPAPPVTAAEAVKNILGNWGAPLQPQAPTLGFTHTPPRSEYWVLQYVDEKNERVWFLALSGNVKESYYHGSEYRDKALEFNTEAEAEFALKRAEASGNIAPDVYKPVKITVTYSKDF